MTRIDITQPDRAIHLIESTMQDNRYEKSKEHMEKARNDILNKYNLFPMICDVIHKSQANLDRSVYVRQRMLPRFSKALSFLFRNIGHFYQQS
jgi:glutamate mutase epsilon subunit